MTIVYLQCTSHPYGMSTIASSCTTVFEHKFSHLMGFDCPSLSNYAIGLVDTQLYAYTLGKYTDFQPLTHTNEEEKKYVKIHFWRPYARQHYPTFCTLHSVQ